MNTELTDEKASVTPEVTRSYQAIVWIDEPGKFLLGGQKQVRSIFFDTRQEAQDWLTQCVHTNQGCSSLHNVKIHGRIKGA